MCIIIDANLAALVFSSDTPDDFCPLIDWLTVATKDGKLVIGGKLTREIDKVAVARRFVTVLLRAGRARVLPSDVVDEEANRIANSCESDDPHVIALAIISGARILCSQDRTLHRDFTNRALISNPSGHIYQNEEHAHLLRRYGHTEACRRSMNME
jgi:hypothetical protein